MGNQSMNQRRMLWAALVVVTVLLTNCGKQIDSSTLVAHYATIAVARHELDGEGQVASVEAADSASADMRNAVVVVPSVTVPAAVASTTPESMPVPMTMAALPGSIPDDGAVPFEPTILAARMLELVNHDRAAAGLGLVSWDDTAAAAGQDHTDDMVHRGFFSHWNPDGLGPDHRYSAAGGRHVARENLYTFSLTYEDGRGAPVNDWEVIIEQAQASLMGSLGHRENILDPAHTHVGIGLTYDPVLGQFLLAQEFTNQHVTLSLPLPTEARPGDLLRVVGSFGPETVGGGILDLAHEPFPAPLSPADLTGRSTYMSTAKSVGSSRSVASQFDEIITLPPTPGYYHVRLFVDLESGQALVMDHIAAVR